MSPNRKPLIKSFIISIRGNKNKFQKQDIESSQQVIMLLNFLFDNKKQKTVLETGNLIV